MCLVVCPKPPCAAAVATATAAAAAMAETAPAAVAAATAMAAATTPAAAAAAAVAVAVAAAAAQPLTVVLSSRRRQGANISYRAYEDPMHCCSPVPDPEFLVNTVYLVWARVTYDSRDD